MASKKNNDKQYPLKPITSEKKNDNILDLDSDLNAKLSKQLLSNYLEHENQSYSHQIDTSLS